MAWGIAVAALAALVMVLAVAWPLLRRTGAPTDPDGREDERQRVEEDLQRSLAAIEEIEQDRQAGNLSTADFEKLDAAERAEAVDLMRRRDALAAADGPSAGTPSDTGEQGAGEPPSNRQ